VLPEYPGTLKLNNHEITIPDGIQLKSIHMGINPSMPWYGHIMAIIECAGHIYECRFRVHIPGQSANMANQMTEIQEIKSYNALFPHYIRQDTDFGHKAFWQKTPDSTLTGDDLLLRQLMRALKHYSVKNQLCKKLRREERKISMKQT